MKDALIFIRYCTHVHFGVSIVGGEDVMQHLSIYAVQDACKHMK